MAYITKRIVLALILLASAAFAADQSPYPPWQRFGFGVRESLADLKMQPPEVTLTDQEREKLYRGEIITRLMDAPEGYKLGYLRFFAPFDPVTAYMVVSDAESYDETDPAFDATGSVSNKRRSFWPNAIENDACVEHGEVRMNQLIVLPLISPRKVCLAGSFDTTAFPWESHWDLAGDSVCCLSQRDPELQRYYDKAVVVTRNKESWHISPLPPEFRRTPQDILRTDCIYIADVNPGGELGRMEYIANMAAKTSLPQIARHTVARGKSWESFLESRYGSRMAQQYRGWVRMYREAIQDGEGKQLQ